MSAKRTSKPISDAKIAANRANARKSTGPQTPEGKARVAQNAIKHGLLADVAFIPSDPGEDQAAFDELCRLLIIEHKPKGPSERLLIERITICYWRLRRVLRYEADCVWKDRASGNCGLRQGDDITEYDAAGSRGILPVGPDFDRLIRYETMIERQLNRLLDRLAAIQEDRASDNHSEEPNEPTEPTQPAVYNQLAPVSPSTPPSTQAAPATPDHSSSDPCGPVAPNKPTDDAAIEYQSSIPDDKQTRSQSATPDSSSLQDHPHTTPAPNKPTEPLPPVPNMREAGNLPAGPPICV